MRTFSPRSQGTDTLSQEQGRRCRNNVLIIDDNENLRIMLDYVLSSHGLQVMLCEDGPDALHRSSTEDYDYIVIDYNMPEITGVELTRQLREVCPRAIIIGMSGEERGVAFLNAGANDFLQKPFLPELLAEMICGKNAPPAG